MSDSLDDLTILIPAFRCAKYLPATISSALRCEGAKVLIAEDASGDDTVEVARAWRDAHPNRISLIENPVNLGMTVNWINSFQQVDTTYCLKLDGDDIILHRYVQTALAWLRANREVGILAGKPRIIDSDSYLEPTWDAQADDVSVATPVQIKGVEACRFVLKWDPFPCSSSTFYRMDVWRQAGGFDPQLSWASDQEMWFRIARIADIGWYNGDAALYRLHSDNVTAKVTREDKRCYEYDYMYTKAIKIWPEAELKPYFGKELLKISKSYLASVLRSIRHRPSEIPYRSSKGIRCFTKAMRVYA